MKIAFFDTAPYEEEYFSEKCPDYIHKVYLKDSLKNDTEISDDALDCDILSVFVPSDLSKDNLKKFKNLKYILLRSVGYSHVDLDYTKEKGICVFNAPNYGDYTVAEYVFAILLSLIRKVEIASQGLKKGEICYRKFVGMELYNKTMGVVGTGAIGSKVVKIAKGFSMNVLAYDIKPSTDASYVTLDELCRKSDIISINSPLTKETYHMFNKDRFSLMKEGAAIVNTARGEIIDTNALYDALISEKVSYAALDVIECEEILSQKPDKKVDLKDIKESCLKKYLISNKLMKFENVLITPHVAYDTIEAIQRILDITLENLNSCLEIEKTDAGEAENCSVKNLILV